MRKFEAQKELVLPSGERIAKGTQRAALVGIPAELMGFWTTIEVADDESKADKDSGKKAPKKR